MKRTTLLIAFFFISNILSAQIQASVVGKVVNGFSKPVVGASVRLVGIDSEYNQSTDQDGRFAFLVMPGRYQLTVSFIGFSQSDEELLVIAGKISQLTIALNESAVQLDDVEVQSGQGNTEIQGGYTISIEKTMRVPANFFDPVRMATSLPGVVSTNDQGNSISVKGYSPNALLWRLQGLDIVNPNHLANAGTLSDKPVANGGGVSILSSQVLDKTDFYSGSLPIQYGNALSGAMDMSLRPGNKFKKEHTVQASLIGIDLATEGPMGDPLTPEGGTPSQSKSSYLINYRYSTIGLLSLAGVNFGDEKINFQDLTFHLDFDQKKGRHLSVFGFGGLSSNQFDRKDTADYETEKDRYDIDFKGKVFGAGFLSTLHANEKSNLKMGVAVSGQYQSRKSQSEEINYLPNYIISEVYQGDRTLISAKLDYAQRISPSINLLAGLVASSVHHKLNVETITQSFISNVTFPNLNGSVRGILFQPYISTSWQTKLATITGGVRYVNFTYNNSSSLEPRLSIARQILKGQLSMAYGITSQMQQPQAYLGENSSNLALTRAHQFSIAYNRNLAKGLSLKSNAYYHRLFDVPLAQTQDIVPISAINQMDEFVTDNMASNGMGRNKGIEFSLEKKFLNQLYFLAGGAWYGSDYSERNMATYYQSRYSGKFTSTFSGGKEWSRKKNKTFGVHSRILYLGGLRQQQINLPMSSAYGTTVYVDNNYSVQLPDYFRFDLRVSWRKNKSNYTRTISLDIQNLSNQQNSAFYYYDTYLRTVEQKFQLGLIPVLVYRIDF